MKQTHKLWFKRLLYPGFNLGSRSRSSIARFFLRESACVILDIGCGNGFFTFAAMQKGGRAVGISFDADQIRRCNEMRNLLGLSESRVRFEVVNATTLSNWEERFSQILMLEVLEHLDQDAPVIAQAYRLLEPGGILQITTPDVDLGRWVGGLDRKARGGHCRLGYSKEHLEKLCRTAGFDVVLQSRIGSFGDFLSPLQLKLNHLIGRGLLGEAVVFAILYPAYALMRLVPLARQNRIFHHLIVRKRLEKT